jgi:outer membrane protein assembly factor BamB
LPFLAHPFKWGMRLRKPDPTSAALAAVVVLGCAGPLGPEVRAPTVVRTSDPVAGVTAAPVGVPLLPTSSGELAPAQPVTVAWSYRAGAPLAAPPGIGADGTVALGSVDGYLHSLRGDGSFRWGYTLRGPLIGRPAIAPNGSVFAAANPNGLYALDSEGALLWVSSVAGGVRSAPVVDSERRVWVTTGQGTLLGFSSRGGIVGFARIGTAGTVGPAPLADGGVAIASVDGDLKIAGDPRRAPRPSAPGPVLGLDAAEDSLFVLAADGLARIDLTAGEERWSRTDVARVACATPTLVVVEGAGLRWLSTHGEPQALVRVSVGAERPIACLGDGSLLVLDDDGALLRVDATGVRARGTLPAGRLVSLDEARGELAIAAYRDGRVLAFRPPTAP